MKRNRILYMAIALLTVLSCSNLKDGTYQISVVSTSDGHGKWLGSFKESKRERPSLLNTSAWLNDYRAQKGAENVLLIDVGDNLSGNPAPFYYNYIQTKEPHLFPRLAAYLGYDAIVPGTADWATGHDIYDRVAKELKAGGIEVLSGNATDESTGKSYFPCYTICKKNGIRIAVLGFSNSAVAAQVDKAAISGIHFENILDCAQKEVDQVISAEKPHLVVVAVHSGVGKGDGGNLSKQGQDLLASLKNVDLILCGQDHYKEQMDKDGTYLMDQSAYYRDLGLAEIELTVKDGEIVGKKISTSNPRMETDVKDSVMMATFQKEYDEIFAFANDTIGRLAVTLDAMDAYKGSSNYMNLYHTLALSQENVDISLQAPLILEGELTPRALSYNDLPYLYKFDNQMIVLKLTGKEIKAFLEKSYENQLEDEKASIFKRQPVLKLKTSKSYQTKKTEYNFKVSPAHYDSGGGLVYTVDITKPAGERVNIISMADGSEFSLEKEYNAAITSYRSVGAGGLLQAIGLDSMEKVEERIVLRGPLYRDLLYFWLKENGEINLEKISKPEVVGSWKYIPEKKAIEGIEKDLQLIFKDEDK